MSIDSETRNQIRRLFYVNHFSINAICESVGVHHETVKRAINYHAFVRVKSKPSRSSWAEHEDIIRKLLKSYPKLTSTRLLKILSEKGFSGDSLDSLRKFVRKVRPQVREAFIKRTPMPAEGAQVDWGHFGSLKIGRATRKLYCFVMTLSWSRYSFAKFTFDLKTETFLSCHVDAFRFFKGVPRILLYDNLKSIVLERQGGVVRFNPMALEFAAHYHYESRACNPYRGNEKGRVERKIRFIRDSFFAARDLVDIESLNREVLDWLNTTANLTPWPDNRDKNLTEKFQEEQPKLIRIPTYHPCPEISKVVTAGKYSHITFDLNKYSIPMNYVQRISWSVRQMKQSRFMPRQRRLPNTKDLGIATRKFLMKIIERSSLPGRKKEGLPLCAATFLLKLLNWNSSIKLLLIEGSP